MYKKIRDYIVYTIILEGIYRDMAAIAYSPEMFHVYMDKIDNSGLSEYKQAHLVNHLIDAMGYY